MLRTTDYGLFCSFFVTRGLPLFSEPRPSGAVKGIRSIPYNFGFGGGNSLAGHTDSNPVRPCDPSQKGLFKDCPQRHKPMVVRPARSKGFPSIS
jgi:hypothetical protein